MKNTFSGAPQVVRFSLSIDSKGTSRLLPTEKEKALLQRTGSDIGKEIQEDRSSSLGSRLLAYELFLLFVSS